MQATVRRVKQRPLRGVSRLAMQALARWADILEPPPERTAVEWAEMYRVITIGPEKGPWRSGRTPFALEIIRAVYDPRYSRVVWVTASQLGKTEWLLNIIGQRLDDDPTPTVYVGPSKNFVESQFEPRLSSMLRTVPSLWAKLAKGKRDRKTAKLVGGVPLRLAWAGSATELASQPAGLGIVDERDRMDANVRGEGDPGELLEARGKNFPDFKAVYTSSPTEGRTETVVHPETGFEHWAEPEDLGDIQSPTWKLFLEGTRHEWAWPCPRCGEYFIPRFKHLWWPEGCGPRRAKREAKMRCFRCGGLIGSEEKAAMNARGRYVAPGQRVEKDGTVVGDALESSTASFWCSGLASAWRTFGESAERWLRAARSGDMERVQGVINTEFGELYAIARESVHWAAVANLREPYAFDTVPVGVRVLVAGIDVQKDRLFYEIRGFGYRMESWQIRHGELHGETDQDAVWNDLADLLSMTWDGHRIRIACIDSGYRPGDRFKRPDNRIYDFCRQYHGARPTKGHDVQDRPLKAAMIDVTIGGRVVKGGLQLWHLDSDFFKSFVHTRISWPPGTLGGWHLSQDTTDDYCAQLVAETRIVKPSGYATWARLRRENHYLDTAALCTAAAYMLQVHLLQEPETRVSREGDDAPEPAPVVRSNWMSRVHGR